MQTRAKYSCAIPPCHQLVIVPIIFSNYGININLGRSMNKKDLSERDISTKFITPALKQSGWNVLSQIREEVSFTKGRIIVRGKLVTRGKAKRADYILYYKPNVPLALIEAKDNNHAVGDGMQQGLENRSKSSAPFSSYAGFQSQSFRVFLLMQGPEYYEHGF